MKTKEKISTWDNPKLFADFLIENIGIDYKKRLDTIGRPFMQYKELSRMLETYDVVFQYGDFFIIMPYDIENQDLPLLDILLRKPYNGKLYVSKVDNRMQIRISGYTIEKSYYENI